MDIFITGATGYIGFNVAKTLRRAGHRVWGMTRSSEKAKRLARHEIHPVVGDMDRPETYREAADRCSVLIHAAFDYEGGGVEKDRKTVETFLESGEEGPWPKTLIYTSGCWVIGDTGDGMADETTSLDPIDMVAWRPEHEELVLRAERVRGLVIRPGCVYGKSGGLTGLWFKGAENGSLDIVGDGSNYWTMVHVDDLAEAYLRAVESGLIAEDFNISDRSRWTVAEMAQAAAGAAGYEGEITSLSIEEATDEMGPMAEALALNQHVDARKAVRMLDWHPKHGGFVDEVDTYYQAWKAHSG